VPAPYRIESFEGARGGAFQTQFKGLSADRLPCGSYKYVLARADFDAPAPRITGEVYLQEERQSMTVTPSRSAIVGSGGVVFVDRARRLVRGSADNCDRDRKTETSS
jgi:hypothetical protein